jgi:hypothetical protein
METTTMSRPTIEGTAGRLERLAGSAAGQPLGGADDGLNESAIAELLSARRKAREQAIDRLQERAGRQGDVTDRLYWTMVYDFEIAPLTTNLEQLRELGISMPPPSTLDDASLVEALWRVIRGLARLDVYLVHTDHLDDRHLYAELHDRVLREQVRAVPAGSGVHEFIDLSFGEVPDEDLSEEAYLAKWTPDGERLPVVDRDRLLPTPEESDSQRRSA